MIDALNGPRRPVCCLAAVGRDGLERLLGDGVDAIAVGALLRFDLEAHLLDDGTTEESPHAVGLASGCGHEVFQSGPVRLA